MEGSQYMSSIEVENEMLVQERIKTNHLIRKMQAEGIQIQKDLARKKDYHETGLPLIDELEEEIRKVEEELLNLHPVFKKTQKLKRDIEVEKVNRPFLKDTVDELKLRKKELQEEYQRKREEVVEWNEKYIKLRDELFYLENPQLLNQAEEANDEEEEQNDGGDM